MYKLENNFKNQFCPSTMWGLGIELGLSGLAAYAFTCGRAAWPCRFLQLTQHTSISHFVICSSRDRQCERHRCVVGTWVST